MKLENTQPHNLPPPATTPHTTRCTDWYTEGESRVVVVGDVRIVITFLGQKGRRGRLQIEAPAGAEFEEVCLARPDGRDRSSVER